MAFIDPNEPTARTAPFLPQPVPEAPRRPPANKPVNPAVNPWLTDPGYLAATTQETFRGQQLDQQSRDTIARLLVQFGDTSIAGRAGLGGLDPAIAAEAAANTRAGNSIIARLMHAHELERRGVVNGLAGHGLLFSGDTGYRLGEADKSYGNQVNDAQQEFINQILGVSQNTLQQKDQLHQGVIGALENAYNNYVANPAYYGQAQNPKPKAKPSPVAPWRSALQARSAGLNARYGLG